MHIPDGFLDGTTAVATGAVAVGGVAYAVRRSRNDLGDRAVPVLGVTAAFVFAAQMINFPVAGGTSGHLLGALLAAVLVGPWASVLVMAAVVGLQAVGMADGGITALGANILNMAVVGGLGGYGVFLVLRRLVGGSRAGFLAAVAVSAWTSVVLASGAAALELAFSGTVPLGAVLPAMISVHMVIGLGEAIITSAVVSAVLVSRPDLIRTAQGASWLGERPGPAGAPNRRLRLGAFVAAALVVSLAVAVFLSPFASTLPDGLERVAEDTGFSENAGDGAFSFSPLPDYEFPGLSSVPAVAVAGLAGTLAVFGLVFMTGRLIGRRAEGGSDDDPGHGHGAVGHRHAGHTHHT